MGIARARDDYSGLDQAEAALDVLKPDPYAVETSAVVRESRALMRQALLDLAHAQFDTGDPLSTGSRSARSRRR